MAQVSKANIHRFSPIVNEAVCAKALAYIAEQAGLLSLKLTGTALPIDTLCLLAHYLEEEQFLLEFVQQYGPVDTLHSNDRTLYVHSERLAVSNHNIQYLGVRRVDPYRFGYVGYADFAVDDPAAFAAEHCGQVAGGMVRQTPGHPDLIELAHPDFDVLAYIPNDH